MMSMVLLGGILIHITYFRLPINHSAIESCRLFTFSWWSYITLPTGGPEKRSVGTLKIHRAGSIQDYYFLTISNL